MTNAPKFNYIVTIHNKEDRIEKVITAVLVCCRDNSHIYAVLDGCTDNTEKVIDSIIEQYSNVPITKVYTDDVHELLSINAGLRAAKHEGEGYNIILQDDVIINDFMLEEKIIKLYKWRGDKLGYVSLRLGVNFAHDAATSKASIPFIDYLENAYGHGLSNAKVLLPGQFAYRNIPIKSPVCIPFRLMKKVGFLEEKLAPYGHDDVDYAIRCMKVGYYNGVFAVRFQSNIKWGGTREKIHPQMAKIIAHNMELIRGWHQKDIAKISKNKKNLEVIEIPGMATEEEKQLAKIIWKKNQKALENFQKHERSIYERIAILLWHALKKAISLVVNFKNAARSKIDERIYGRYQKKYSPDLSFSKAIKCYPKRNDLYAYMHHYFYHFCPQEIRAHRTYFSKDMRGFGENAFHTMWWLLLREFKPKRCLEIGVYRGQVISLFSLIAKLLNFPCEAHGVAPFSSIGHQDYPKDLDYLADVKKNFQHFHLPKPTLVKACSNDPKAVKHIQSQKWDLIYIDGAHDFETALFDYKLSRDNLAKGGILVLDDSSLGTSFQPPSFASAGCPGPSRVAQEYAMEEMDFLGAVGHNSIFRKKG